MAPRKNEVTEVYAVLKGRIDEPTIFSSWGDVHPRVTGCEAVYKRFSTPQKALAYMEHHTVFSPKQVKKKGAGASTPGGGSDGYYAVANGRKPGIYQYWRGQTQALSQLHETPYACCKRFKTKEQAEAFIEDWKQTVDDLFLRAIREALDQGWRPNDMSFSIAGLLDWKQDKMAGQNGTIGLDLEALEQLSHRALVWTLTRKGKREENEEKNGEEKGEEEVERPQ